MRVLRCETKGADVPLFAAEETKTLAATVTAPITFTVSVSVVAAVAVAREAPEIAASLGPGVARSLGEVAVADTDAGLEGRVFLSGRVIRLCFSCTLSCGLVPENGK